MYYESKLYHSKPIQHVDCEDICLYVCSTLNEVSVSDATADIVSTEAAPIFALVFTSVIVNHKNSLNSLAITNRVKFVLLVVVCLLRHYSYVKRFIPFEISSHQLILSLLVAQVTLGLSTQWRKRCSALFLRFPFFFHLSNEHEK